MMTPTDRAFLLTLAFVNFSNYTSQEIVEQVSVQYGFPQSDAKLIVGTALCMDPAVALAILINQIGMSQVLQLIATIHHDQVTAKPRDLRDYN